MSEVLKVGDVVDAVITVEFNYGVYDVFINEKLHQIIDEVSRKLSEAGFKLYEFTAVLNYHYLYTYEYPYVIGFDAKVVFEKVSDPIPLTTVVAIISSVIIMYLGVELVRSVTLREYYITYREAIEKGVPPPEKPTIPGTIPGLDILGAIPPIALLFLILMLIKEVRK